MEHKLDLQKAFLIRTWNVKKPEQTDRLIHRVAVISVLNVLRSRQAEAWISRVFFIACKRTITFLDCICLESNSYLEHLQFYSFQLAKLFRSIAEFSASR